MRSGPGVVAQFFLRSVAVEQSFLVGGKVWIFKQRIFSNILISQLISKIKIIKVSVKQTFNNLDIFSVDMMPRLLWEEWMSSSNCCSYCDSSPVKVFTWHLSLTSTLLTMDSNLHLADLVHGTRVLKQRWAPLATLWPYSFYINHHLNLVKWEPKYYPI